LKKAGCLMVLLQQFLDTHVRHKDNSNEGKA
jgi:hypothetical protein